MKLGMLDFYFKISSIIVYGCEPLTLMSNTIFFRLELNMELPSGQVGSIGTSTAVSQEQDELTQRLARLRE